MSITTKVEYGRDETSFQDEENVEPESETNSEDEDQR